jgi:hypothetical protein
LSTGSLNLREGQCPDQTFSNSAASHTRVRILRARE